MVDAILENWRTAPIDDKLRSTLGFLEKLTLRPNEVGPEDIAPMRQTGVSHEAIEDAVHVCAYFNLIDRMADSLEFHVPDAAAFKQTGQSLLERGYVG